MYRIGLHILSFTLFYALSICSAAAHEIHLKSGGVIKTDRIERTGSRLSYEQFGGMVTIDLSEVEQIRYTTRSDSRQPSPSGSSL